MFFFLLLSGGGAICRRVRLVGCDNVSDVSDAVIIKIKVTEVSLTCVNQNSEKFQDGLITLALSESLHRCVDKVELLLQIVEADLHVDSVPVKHLLVESIRCDQAAIDILLIKDVEKFEEQFYRK